MSDFRAYKADRIIDGVTFYFIESTVPDNVERRDKPVVAGGRMTFVDPDQAVEEIVDTLVPRDNRSVDANLVVMVHGFNTPRPKVLEFYENAAKALNADQAAIFGNHGRRTVCVGYRWPSERIFQVLSSSFKALPLAPLAFFTLACIVLAATAVQWVASWLHWNMGWLAPLTGLVWLTVMALALFTFTIVIILLRAIVYFRDVYRATNYGVPDLVEVIRQIDHEASRRIDETWEDGDPPRKRIALSFVGHSMGGLVVTNAIRVLFDVFDKDVIRTTLSGTKLNHTGADTDDEFEPVPGRIGHVFELTRFVLVSPDTPAETLMAAGRANFLASSLRRFREAYLFSNEGDEVLRMISTIVNYFSFPTRRRRYGYRLGNLEILSEGFGEIPSDRPSEALRVGSRTLAALSRDKPGALVKVNPAAVAKAFTYFDCTDYVDEPGNKGFLTEAQNRKANNSHGRISYPGHLWLPCRYVFPIGSINVHGGYFDGAATRQLIFRLACLGYDGATDAYQHEQKTIPTICSRHQIRVMLSPWLNYHPSRENMETPAMAASVRRPEPHAA